jgi:SAM-dependent methyltransferase
MVISFIKKIKLIGIIWSCVPQTPFRTMLKLFFKPIESVRYTEISYIINFIQNTRVNTFSCLDISSPYILSYILSKGGCVIKTDISSDERRFIKESKNLKFEIQNVLALTYPHNSFDFVYSISVIEHIYQGLHQSVSEMIRVAKPGGYIYITFPVSVKYQEEWLNENIYSNQYKNGDKIFFQYRLDKVRLESFLLNLSNVEIVKKDIYWEKKNHSYNKMILELKKTDSKTPLGFLKNALINYYYGFTLLNSFPENFEKAKEYGNVSIILQKLK